MNTTTLQLIYMSLAAGLMIGWLLLVVIGPRELGDSKVLGVLRYGVGLRTLALVVAVLPPMIMIVVLWFVRWPDSQRLHLAGVALLATSIGAGLLLIEVTRGQVAVSEQGLTRISPWSKDVGLQWSEVERIRYSAVNRWFVVEGAGRTIRVSRHLARIDVFAAAVRRKVAAERWASVAAALRLLI